jgi:hypothetical protein
MLLGMFSKGLLIKEVYMEDDDKAISDIVNTSTTTHDK